MSRSITLTWHVDPGHEWLEASYSLVSSLGIRENLTEYSHYSQSKQLFYLEGDCDAGTLIDALTAIGISVEYKIREYAHTAPLTRLPRLGGGK